MSRVVVVGLVAAALLLGHVAEGLIFALVLVAWAGLGASLGPATILALYWRRTTRAGAAAGVVTGTVVTVVWYFTPALKGAVYELIPAFAAAMAATISVSLLTRSPAESGEMMSAMRGAGPGRAASDPEGREEEERAGEGAAG